MRAVLGNFSKLICICQLILCLGLEEPLVSTDLGMVKGTWKLSFSGRVFASFEGIPFAKPPTGSRRFEEPEPVEPWAKAFDARNPTICAQATMLEPREIKGSEDCLHLNIYVPKSAEPGNKRTMDVIIHIHGGAFMWGSGTNHLNPKFFMDHDVVFVTFNYRLGILGFLSTEDDAIPGNMGLKDQVLALKWVQRHIKSFGGNPNSVTLTGLSAGSASTHLHYFSNMSKELFHRGFAQSGTALNGWALQENPFKRTQKLAGLLGCSRTTTMELAKCLKTLPVEQMLIKISHFYTYLFLPVTPFGPVLETGPKAFLSDYPWVLLKNRKVLDVPLIISQTSHEGLYPVAFFLKDLGTISKNWLDWAPYLLEFGETLQGGNYRNVSQQIKDFYIGPNQDFNLVNYPQLVQMFGDRAFYVDSEKAVVEQGKLSPVYSFRFQYPHNEVAAHGADAKYYFGSKTGKNLSENQLKMKDLLLGMLIEYAKTGVPKFGNFTLPLCNSSHVKYVQISGFLPNDINSVEYDNSRVHNFWTQLGFKENEHLMDD